MPIDRFRGNIVVTGGAAFAEDEWAAVRVGACVFRCVGPCQRCQMVCIDQVRQLGCHGDGRHTLRVFSRSEKEIPVCYASDFAEHRRADK